ncbi:MAG: N-formylglutamate amidohydrolase [Bacteroidales bacterium]|jgi:N-formylglutamate amidohydrolase
MILHIPHSSTKIPDGVVFDKSIEEDLLRMTDWRTDELFDYCSMATVVFPYSRLFCDVERFIDDEPMEQQGHGICYTKDSFGGHLRYVSDEERLDIIEKYYKPHHTKFAIACNFALSLFNEVVIVDCHSFSDEVLPHEPNKNPIRPDFCIGVDDFHTPQILVDEIKGYLESKGFVVSINEPFAGTIVPLVHYKKNEYLKSIMIEVNRKLYLGKSEEDFEYITGIIEGALNIVDAYEISK